MRPSRLLLAQTDCGYLFDLYLNLEVWGEYVSRRCCFDMTFAQWCGVEPDQYDSNLVWC